VDEQRFESPDAIAPVSHTWAGRVTFIVFGVAAAYFLWTEHRAHVLQYLPWSFLLICPLMHLFMHHGHGAHESTSKNSDRDPGQ